MPQSAGFVGRGLAFPLRTDATGSLVLAEGGDDLNEAIQLIIATVPGERPMRPDFGCRIHEHVFAPVNAATVGMIAYEVERAIVRWEPRVDVEDVAVYADEQEQGLLFIEVTYRVKHSNDERNLVFPFYVIPEGEE